MFALSSTNLGVKPAAGSLLGLGALLREQSWKPNKARERDTFSVPFLCRDWAWLYTPQEAFRFNSSSTSRHLCDNTSGFLSWATGYRNATLFHLCLGEKHKKKSFDMGWMQLFCFCWFCFQFWFASFKEKNTLDFVFVIFFLILLWF